MRLVEGRVRAAAAADGFSHARSLAFVTSLVLVQGLIALVGFAAAFGDLAHQPRDRRRPSRAPCRAPPASSSRTPSQQAREVGVDHRYLPLAARPGRHARHRRRPRWARSSGASTGSTASRRDRPAAREVRSGIRARGGRGQPPRAARSSSSRSVAGATAARTFLAHRRGRGSAGRSGSLVAMLALTGAPAVVAAPAPARVVVARVRRRRRASPAGLLVTVGARAASSARAPRSATTYGPLAGIVALQLWTLFSAIAIFFGAAVAAQLEAVRAGAPSPPSRTPRSIPRRAGGASRRTLLRVVEPTLTTLRDPAMLDATLPAASRADA